MRFNVYVDDEYRVNVHDDASSVDGYASESEVSDHARQWGSRFGSV